jgi:hypothetical protein
MITAILGALLWGIPMTFLMQRPPVWAIGPHFAQHLALWLVMGALLGCFMRYVNLRRTRNKV